MRVLSVSTKGSMDDAYCAKVVAIQTCFNLGEQKPITQSQVGCIQKDWAAFFGQIISWQPHFHLFLVQMGTQFMVLQHFHNPFLKAFCYWWTCTDEGQQPFLNILCISEAPLLIFMLNLMAYHCSKLIFIVPMIRHLSRYLQNRCMCSVEARM